MLLCIKCYNLSKVLVVIDTKQIEKLSMWIKTNHIIIKLTAVLTEFCTGKTTNTQRWCLVILTSSSRWQRRELDMFRFMVWRPWRWNNGTLREVLKCTGKKSHEIHASGLQSISKQCLVVTEMPIVVNHPPHQQLFVQQFHLLP